MRKLKQIYFTFFILLATLNAMAQGSIKGIVQLNDSKPAAYVTVQMQGTAKAAMTAEDGTFNFNNVAAGTYTLLVGLVNYKPTTQVVTIANNKNTRTIITLAISEEQLQEVIVTTGRSSYKANLPSRSLRLNESLLETPQNIQVVTNQVLKDQQIFDMLEGVTRNVSGATRVEHWDNYARINMRGTNIASFRNGMNISSTWGPLAEDMCFVERIEFVKGPAGFMLANGEPGGMYNVVTKKPTGNNKRNLDFTYGSYDTYRAALDVDGKLSKDNKLLYRLNVMTERKGSHRDFDYNNRRTIAPVITYNINDKTSITAEYAYQYSEMALMGSAYLFSPNKYGEVDRKSSILEPNIEPTKINDHSTQLTFNRNLAKGWNLTALFGYFNYKQLGFDIWADGITPAGDLQRRLYLWDAVAENTLGQVFANGDIKTGTITHKILAGIDAGRKLYWADFYQSGLLGTPFNVFNPVHGVADNALPLFDRSNIKDRANAAGGRLNQKYIAGYVQDELRFLNDKLRVTAALRYTSVTQSDYGTKYKGDKLTPRIGLSYSLTKLSSIYALYDQAFVPASGFDSVKLRGFRPITGNNIELGYKQDFADGKWNATASIYQITKNNVATGVSGRPNAQTQLGETETKGAELDVRGQIFKGLDLTLNYAYTNAKVSKDNDKNIEGNQIPGSARHVTNGWLSYRLQTTALKGLGIALGYQYQIKRSSWFVFDGSDQSLPNYFRMDGNISYQKDNISIGVNVNNILNKYLYSGAPVDFNYDGTNDGFYYQAEAPTNFRVSIGYRF